MSEEWRNIHGFEGLYQVSNFGRVKSLEFKQTIKNRWGTLTTRVIKEKMLKDWRPAHQRKYAHVILYKNGKGKTAGIHTLVAAAFLGPRPVSMVICHNDGNKANNNVDNLRYGTVKENSEDDIKHGVNFFKNGENHPTSKLSNKDVIEIRSRFACGENQTKIANDYGIVQQTVSGICREKVWKHV